MYKIRWILVFLLLTAGTCFLLLSLYKKHEATKLTNFRSSGAYYNLVQPNLAVIDSLKNTDAYLYLFYRGVELSKQKKPDSAASVFKQMIKMKPNVAFAYCELGKAFLVSKSYDSSLFYLNKALLIKPHYTQALHFKNIAEHRVNGDEDYD